LRIEASSNRPTQSGAGSSIVDIPSFTVFRCHGFSFRL
jgi:hypothetical protein